MTTISPTSGAQTRRIDHLDAVVYLGVVPPSVAEGIAALYGSFRCSPEYHATFSRHQPSGACVLRNPQEMLLFAVSGRTIKVLNMVSSIAPADLRRACRALFVALPGARAIHVEAMFRPGEMGVPTWTLRRRHHLGIDLPESVEEYDAMIGRSTRRRLRGQLNRLRREHPDLATVVLPPGAESRAMVEPFLAWKNDRFHELRRTTFWDEDRGLADRFADLVEHEGEAHVTMIDGKPRAIVFTFTAGDTICALEASHDPQFDTASLGLQALCEVAREAVRRGARRLDMTSDTREYKERIGATLQEVSVISVFRRQADRIWVPRDGLEVAVRFSVRRGRVCYWRVSNYYWRVRHAARRVLERLGLLRLLEPRP